MEEIVYSRCGGVGLGVGVHVAIAVERCEPAADWGDFSLGIWLVVKGFRRARCPPSRQRNFRSPRVPVRALEITSGGSKLRGPGMCLRGRPKGDIMRTIRRPIRTALAVLAVAAVPAGAVAVPALAGT